MKEQINGIAVSRGIAIGRALLLGQEPLQVKHYLISEKHIEREIKRLQAGFELAVQELRRVQKSITSDASSAELHALLDVHAMLLEDPALQMGAAAFIQKRRYNAEWALMQQLAHFSREFDAMEDSYLRERKVDLEQLVTRVVHCMRAPDVAAVQGSSSLGEFVAVFGAHGQAAHAGAASDAPAAAPQVDCQPQDWPFIIVAHDLAPADMLHFKSVAFAGFVADTGGITSHTTIVARSLDIPAVVGTKNASKRIAQDAILIIHAEAGLVIVNPDAQTLAHYFQLQKNDVGCVSARQLLHTPAVTQDGQNVELLANIEFPADCEVAIAAGAVGVGLFRSEFLFMGREGVLPDEDEQYLAYKEALLAMKGLPVTIRTVDIGADKMLHSASHQSRSDWDQSALGLRAIRWSLSSPEMFRTQLRALLRAAVHGPLNILLPMLSHFNQVQEARAQLELSRQELRAAQVPFGAVRLGAMVEVPAAALMIEQFLDDVDFISIGSNDLTQYTLAVDRTNEAVAHLFDATHPAVLHLIAHVIAQCHKRGKHVSVCGEIAGDPMVTDLLLGLGLTSFSMHPVQLLQVKERIVQANATQLADWAREVLASNNPHTLIVQHAHLEQVAA